MQFITTQTVFCYSEIYQIVKYRNTYYPDSHPLPNIQEWLDGFLVNAETSTKEEKMHMAIR
jgi:hypothetical protein